MSGPAGPSKKTQIVTIATEVLWFALISYPLLHAYIFLDAEAYERGFFCDDQNIKHPYKEDTVPIIDCFFIWASIVIVFILCCEFVCFLFFKTTGDDRPMSLYGLELFRIFGFCFMGGLFTLLLTELAKFTVGRLRPHFLAVCGVELNRALCVDTVDSIDYMKWVESVNCFKDDTNSTTLADHSAKILKDARKSFLSGHSSFSFYCAMFLVLYLQHRLSDLRAQNPLLMGHMSKTQSRSLKIIYKGLRISRPFLQFAVMALAFYIALSRISDHKHHPMDVLAGSILGIVNACIIVFAIMHFSLKPRIFHELPMSDQDHGLSMDVIDALKSYHNSQKVNNGTSSSCVF